MILKLRAHFTPTEWSFERLAGCLTRISDGHLTDTTVREHHLMALIRSDGGLRKAYWNKGF
jgi:hypothetical protein